MVRTGLDVLLTEHISELKGRRVGIVANHASVTHGLVHISDALSEAGVVIGALFGPEHGVRGDVADGEPIEDAVDERLGVPAFSLYGKNRFPTPESLQLIDVMLIDLQDVGARFYTFLYTMANVMEACGKHDVPVWVLDRPNPISGLNADGPMLEPEFSSFIGKYPIPMRHALTIGELAQLFKSKFDVQCDLNVVRMQGWSREMWFDQTGLPWVLPSPNMPSVDTATVYPGLCLIEGTNVSEGRGTVRPFETFGAPWINSQDIRKTLLDYKLPGVTFREAYFTPNASKFQGQRCAGLQLYVTDRNVFRAPLTGVAVVCALQKLYPDEFAFRPPSSDGRRFFDLLCGTAKVREAVERGDSPWQIAATWESDLKSYQETITGVLLY